MPESVFYITLRSWYKFKVLHLGCSDSILALSPLALKMLSHANPWFATVPCEGERRFVFGDVVTLDMCGTIAAEVGVEQGLLDFLVSSVPINRREGMTGLNGKSLSCRRSIHAR